MAVAALLPCWSARSEGERPVSVPPPAHFLGEHLRLGGEAAAGYFDTGRLGRFPENEFRIDEARLFLDAKVSDSVFLFSELNLAEREQETTDVAIGELYVEVEDVQKLWSGRAPLTLRAGRCDLPFGEEYLTRDAIDNPFISHTLADIWGVDEGVELFGRAGPFDYTVAVQNGGYKKSGDGNGDKAVIARIGLEPCRPLRLSVSAMRTGDLDVERDEQAELWFGNAYLTPVGDPASTTTFHGELAQFDARYTWADGHAAGTFGGIRYDDDDRTADQACEAIYWSAEVAQRVHGPWYVGLRYSAIVADDTFSAPGQADFLPETYYGTVQDIWRISADIGCRVSERLLWKMEYSLERGQRAGDESIRDQDFVATEIAVGF